MLFIVYVCMYIHSLICYDSVERTRSEFSQCKIGILYYCTDNHKCFFIWRTNMIGHVIQKYLQYEIGIIY